MKNFIVLAIVGLAAQLVDGSLGMAYGVTSSTLLLAVGVAPAAASAAVHFSEIGTTLVSGISHHKLGNVDWRLGAQHFLVHLVDGDLASNQLNWQWVAGCGSDAAPYFRVFNPITQGRKFDPDAAYIRRWVPELRDVDDPHEPVDPIVDHAEARREALARWETIGS